MRKTALAAKPTNKYVGQKKRFSKVGRVDLSHIVTWIRGRSIVRLFLEYFFISLLSSDLLNRCTFMFP